MSKMLDYNSRHLCLSIRMTIIDGCSDIPVIIFEIQWEREDITLLLHFKK